MEIRDISVKKDHSVSCFYREYILMATSAKEQMSHDIYSFIQCIII